MRPSPQKILAVVLFAAGVSIFLRWVPDDAYISFRYALNFAEGNGLVFNPGERVEGYSNFLWTIILGLGRKVGIDIVVAAVVLSVVCALGTVVLALRLFDDIAGDVADRHTYRSHLFAVSLILVVSLPMVFWASSGLETFSAAFFLLMGVILHLEAERKGRPEIHVGSVIAYLLVAVLRPEGIGYAAINAAVLLVRHRRRLPRSVAVSLVFSLVVFTIFVASRSFYYGSLVPNTYWAKPSTTIGYADPLLRGARYLARYFIVSGLVLFLPLCVLAFRVPSVRYTVRYLAGVLLVQFAFIVWVGGDVLRFDRLGVAFHPVLLAVALAGAVSWEAMKGKRALLRTGVWAAVLIALTLNGMRIHRAHSKYCIHDWMHAHFHARLGKALREALPSDATLVFNEMGATPYYSRLVTYDMIGLTDKTVGSIIFDSYRLFGTTETPLCQRGISNYLLSRDPTCIILPSRGPIDLTGFSSSPRAFHPIWYGIYSHPEFQREYRADFSVEHNPGKLLHVYVRRGTTLDHSALGLIEGPPCLRVTVHE